MRIADNECRESSGLLCAVHDTSGCRRRERTRPHREIFVNLNEAPL
jgi:hypothetical protein